MPSSGELVKMQGLLVKKTFRQFESGWFSHEKLTRWALQILFNVFLQDRSRYDTKWGGDGIKGIKYPIRHHFCGGLLIPLAFTNFKVTSKPAYKVL